MPTSFPQPVPDLLPDIPAGTYDDPADLRRFLGPYGVTMPILIDTIQYGLRQYLECTPHDPTYFPSVLLVAKTIRYLRDTLVPQGWDAVNLRGYATIVHPSGALAIATSLGNHHTGSKLKAPKTSAPKGAESRSFIEINQPPLFTDMVPRPMRNKKEPSAALTLLMHVFDDERVVNAELSCPTGTEPTGTDNRSHISHWRTRIILPPISFADVDVPIAPTTAPSIDVPLTRNQP